MIPFLVYKRMNQVDIKRMVDRGMSIYFILDLGGKQIAPGKTISDSTIPDTAGLSKLAPDIKAFEHVHFL
jgi:hypothetical protein